MAPRTLPSTWRQFEKLAREINRSNPPTEKQLSTLSDLTVRANRSRITHALETLFVQEYLGMDEVSVQFMGVAEAMTSGLTSAYNPEEKTILLNPLAIVRFIDECQRCMTAMSERGDEETFEHYRLDAYRAELSKLPSQMILFLALLQQVAELMDVTKADKRGSKSPVHEIEEDKPYLKLLWAFKQLEAVFREMKGISLRSEYSILWYEADWIRGRK